MHFNFYIIYSISCIETIFSISVLYFFIWFYEKVSNLDVNISVMPFFRCVIIVIRFSLLKIFGLKWMYSIHLITVCLTRGLKINYKGTKIYQNVVKTRIICEDTQRLCYKPIRHILSEDSKSALLCLNLAKWVFTCAFIVMKTNTQKYKWATETSKLPPRKCFFNHNGPKSSHKRQFFFEFWKLKLLSFSRRRIAKI